MKLVITRGEDNSKLTPETVLNGALVKDFNPFKDDQIILFVRERELLESENKVYENVVKRIVENVDRIGRSGQRTVFDIPFDLSESAILQEISTIQLSVTSTPNFCGRVLRPSSKGREILLNLLPELNVGLGMDLEKDLKRGFDRLINFIYLLLEQGKAKEVDIIYLSQDKFKKDTCSYKELEITIEEYINSQWAHNKVIVGGIPVVFDVNRANGKFKFSFFYNGDCICSEDELSRAFENLLEFLHEELLEGVEVEIDRKQKYV